MLIIVTWFALGNRIPHLGPKIPTLKVYSGIGAWAL